MLCVSVVTIDTSGLMPIILIYQPLALISDVPWCGNMLKVICWRLSFISCVCVATAGHALPQKSDSIQLLTVDRQERRLAIGSELVVSRLCAVKHTPLFSRAGA